MQLNFEFEAGDDKEYQVDSIWNSTIYARELAGQLPRLYYLVLWKSYPEKKNTWEPASAIQYLWKLVTAYYKNNPEKPTAISVPVNTAPPTARLIISPMARLTAAPTKKCGRPAKTTTTKQAKKS